MKVFTKFQLLPSICLRKQTRHNTYLWQCNREIVGCKSSTGKASCGLLNTPRWNIIYCGASWCEWTRHVGNIKAPVNIVQPLNRSCSKNLAIIQLNGRRKWSKSSKCSPPVWWKIGEAAPDWPENDVAKDRPAPSGRFEADPFREDCKENSVIVHIYMLKRINPDLRR